jgi:hypothetical protein
MSVDYIETFKILYNTFGIEDHKDGKGKDKHFFHEDFILGKRKRFEDWRSGCGIGEFDTLEQAKKHLLAYVSADLNERMEKLIHDLEEVFAAKKQLTLKGLDSFKVK